jgi:hypothetical protein
MINVNGIFSIVKKSLQYFFLIPLISCSAHSAPKLDDAIRTYHSKARLVSSGDVDQSCEENNSPGLVWGDFNGDGAVDVAALLMIGDIFERKNAHYMEVKLSLVAFINKNGKYESFPIDLSKMSESDSFSYPLNFQIWREKKGNLREFEGPEIIDMKNDGFAFVHCESSTNVFYWDGKKFNFINVSG